MLYFMRFCAACGGAGARTAFHAQDGAVSGQALQAGEHVEHRAHVGRLFLDPDDVGLFAVAVELGDDLFFWKWIKLFEEDDGRARVFSLLSLGLKFVTDFPGADQDAFGFTDFDVGDDVQELLVSEIFDRRRGVGMAEHALRSKDD